MISLFLEELVAHGEEGDGEAGAEEDDEVEGQLVPGGKDRSSTYTWGRVLK